MSKELLARAISAYIFRSLGEIYIVNKLIVTLIGLPRYVLSDNDLQFDSDRNKISHFDSISYGSALQLITLQAIL